MKTFLTFISAIFMACLPTRTAAITAPVTDTDTYTCHLTRFAGQDRNQAILTGLQPGATLSGDIRLPDSIQVDGSVYEVVALGESNYTSHAGEPAAIHDNDAITSVTIPARYRMIGRYEFTGCHNIASYTVEAGSSKFDSEDGMLYYRLWTDDDGKDTWELYRYPSARRNAVFAIPSRAAYVAAGTFAANTHLRKIYVSGDQELSRSWQLGNKSIESVDCSASIRLREREEGVLFSQGMLHSVCPGLIRASYTVPEGVRYICAGAFCNSSIRQVIIPESVEGSVPEDCFAFSEIEEVIWEADRSPMQVDDCAFLGCGGLKSVRMGAKASGSLRIGTSAFEGCRQLEDVTFTPDVTVVEMGKSVFAVCAALTSLPLTKRMRIPILPEKAFAGCASLTSFPLGLVEEMHTSGYQFEGTGLTQVTVPANISTIPQGCFSDCSALCKITLRMDGGRIMYRALAGTPLTAIALYGVSSYQSSAFDSCGELRRVYFPAGVCDLYYNELPFTTGECEVIVNNPDLKPLEAQRCHPNPNVDLYHCSLSASHDLGSTWRTIYVPGGAREIYEAATSCRVAEMYSYITDKENSSVMIEPLVPGVKITGVTVEGVAATFAEGRWHADVEPSAGSRMNVEVNYTVFRNPMLTVYEYPVDSTLTGVQTQVSDDFSIIGHSRDCVTLSQPAVWHLYTLDGRLLDRGVSSDIDVTSLPQGVYMLHFPEHPEAGMRLHR